MKTQLPSTRRGELKFFKRYTIVMVSVFLAILLSLGSYFAHRLNELSRNELNVIEFYVDGNGQLLDYLFRSTIDQLQLIRLDLESQANRKGHCELGPHALQQAFSQTTEGFALKTNQDTGWQGQLVGAGELTDREPAFYCALSVGLALREYFGNLPNTLSAIDNAYFVSPQGLYVVAPSIPTDALPDPSVVAPALDSYFATIKKQVISYPQKMHEIQTLLSRKHGPAIPISTPIYVNDQFVGSLSIGLSIEFINRMNQKQRYPMGTVYLTNQDGQILVHPEFDAASLIDPDTNPAALAPDTFAPIDTLAALPHATASYHNDQVAIIYRLNTVPWKLAFMVPKAEIRNKILRDFGPGMLGVLAGLAILMIAGYWVTSRYYIRPAARLVSHVYHESNFDPQPMPEVPANWRPWFDAITRAFHESLELNNLQREIDIAAKLQASLLPRHWPKDPRYALWGKMLAAKEVGGDFYDHMQLENGNRALIVADVSGKGIPAGLFGMVSKTYLRSFSLDAQTSVGDIFQRANSQLCQDNDTCMFVTTFYGQYDPQTGIVTMANAGHPPQLLISSNGHIRWVSPPKPSPALGVVEDAPYEPSILQLEPGDQLLIFSDGVTEAMDTRNVEFGFDRLSALFEGQAAASAQAAVERVFEAIALHESGTERSDDITCLVLQRLV
jgi:sigma-B regulation protein RsbU (phosphoserine phosphatase)